MQKQRSGDGYLNIGGIDFRKLSWRTWYCPLNQIRSPFKLNRLWRSPSDHFHRFNPWKCGSNIWARIRISPCPDDANWSLIPTTTYRLSVRLYRLSIISSVCCWIIPIGWERERWGEFDCVSRYWAIISHRSPIESQEMSAESVDE